MFTASSIIGTTAKGIESYKEESVNTLTCSSTAHISLGQDSSLTLGTGDKSHSIWFKTSGTTGKTLFSQGDFTSQPFYRVYLEDGDVLVWARPSGNLGKLWRTSATVNNDAWRHLVVLWNSYSDYDIYKDGSIVGKSSVFNDSVTTIANGSQNATIGNQHTGGSPMTDQVSNFCYFNKTLVVTEIAELYNNGTPKQPWLLSAGLKSSLICALPLNDGPNIQNLYKDYSGNGVDGTATNSPTLTGDSITVLQTSDKGP